ncbi:MAG: oxygenase MpaB family protein [Acidimicrobiales bacterium]
MAATARPGPRTEIHPAAARVWAPEPEWVPPTPGPAELIGGIAGGTFGALASPILAGPVLGAMSALGPGPEGRPIAPDEVGDPGWFGPDSVAWQVHRDPSLLVAGITAFTLQALHPLAMAGVAEHSAFSDDFLGRTRRTGEFVQGVVYGSSARAERLCRMVRASHRPVVGVAPDGRAYSAADPELLEWVHIAEYLAIAAANRRFALRPMSRDELDQYVAEVAVVGEATGVEHPPRSWAELLAALERHRPSLAVGEYAARGVGFLDDPPIIPDRAMPAWRALWSGANVCLPPVARRLLRLRDPGPLELAGCRAVLRMFANLGEGDPPDLASAKVRLGLAG